MLATLTGCGLISSVSIVFVAVVALIGKSMGMTVAHSIGLGIGIYIGTVLMVALAISGYTENMKKGE